MNFHHIFSNIDAKMSLFALENGGMRYVRDVSSKEKNADKNVMAWDLRTGKCLKKFSSFLQSKIALQGEVFLLEKKHFLKVSTL
ncbi:MAG: hypothetical protein JSR80_07725 [Verrucomicrobia bacterium]|nr:hypothetical protein [Verrucomicrobiota bacterium]